jgi:hypothetical protein
MFRVQLEEGDRIVGDSGWRKNTVTNDGLNNYVQQVMAQTAGSLTISHAALGTGGTPASNATTLVGEITQASNSRAAVTLATADRTLQATATFASSDNFITAALNISNVGLFQQSTTETATLLAGNTYASSTLATNQNVNVTYNLVFASSA